MKIQKKKVGILFGGKSVEHEVSIQSAKNVYRSLDKDKYDASLIYIDKSGKWYLYPEKYLLESSFLNKNTSKVKGKRISNIELSVDVIFPVIHGPFGEDGSIQGFLKIINVPFVGPSVLGSAIGMDKDVSKRLLREAGLPIVDFMAFRKSDNINFNFIMKKLGLPFFLKPANLGSSIGVMKIKNEKQFNLAINDVFNYDTKVIAEKYIHCREIECSVLGNESPKASIPGEIVPHHEFYDYTAKYLDDKGSELIIPAELTKTQTKTFQELAIKAFTTLCLEGMARVDFFLSSDGIIYINEVNTIPGFTNSSMYPKLWEESGITYKELIDKLIFFSIQRFQREMKLKSTI